MKPMEKIEPVVMNPKGEGFVYKYYPSGIYKDFLSVHLEI